MPDKEFRVNHIMTFDSESGNLKKAQDMKELERILNELGFQSYLQFGTLLGCIREGDFIKTDDDIDMCYLSELKEPVQIQEEIKGLYDKFKEMGILEGYVLENSSWCGNLSDEIPIELFGQCHVRVGTTLIDLFTSWFDEKNDYWTCQWGNYGSKTQYVPLAPKKLHGTNFSVPWNYERVLSRLYDTWKFPKEEKTNNYLSRRCYLRDLKNVIQKSKKSK